MSPILKAPNLLASVAASRTQLILGVLIDAINSAVVVIIPVVLFPILRKRNEALALGYFGSRVIESVVLIIGHISLLTLATLGQEYAQVAAPGSPYLQTLGALLLAVSDWTFLLGPGVAFGLTALILNYLLYRSRLVPRFIPVWGFVAATLLLADDLLAIFGAMSTTSTVFTLMFLPILLQEMVFAVWLIVKGFSPTAVDSRSAGWVQTR